MTPTEIEGNNQEAKGELKLKFAPLTHNDQLLDQSMQEVRLGKLQVNLGHTKEDLYQCQTSAPTIWFSDWIVEGGERRRIEALQSETRNKKYGKLNRPAFVF